MKPRRRKKQSKFKMGYLVIFIFAFAIFWVWKASEVDRLSRQCSDLDRQKKSLIEQNKSLQIEVERYKSISWIDVKARDIGLTTSVKSRLVLHEVSIRPPKRDLSLYAQLFGWVGDLYDKFVKR